jgi:hypothetical protein
LIEGKKMGFLLWIEESALGVYVQEDPWGFAIALSLHAVGMATVLGIVVDFFLAPYQLKA